MYNGCVVLIRSWVDGNQSTRWFNGIVILPSPCGERHWVEWSGGTTEFMV